MHTTGLTMPPFVPPRRWIEVGQDAGGPFPGLRCEIAALSRDEAMSLLPNQTYSQLAATVAPYVKSWNVALPDKTGAPQPVPPPAEAGPAVFNRIDAGVLSWLRTMLLNAPLLQAHPIDRDDSPAPAPMRPVA